MLYLPRGAPSFDTGAQKYQILPQTSARVDITLATQCNSHNWPAITKCIQNFISPVSLFQMQHVLFNKLHSHSSTLERNRVAPTSSHILSYWSCFITSYNDEAYFSPSSPLTSKLCGAWWHTCLQWSELAVMFECIMRISLSAQLVHPAHQSYYANLWGKVSFMHHALSSQ